jgi:hypothetical protein
VGRVSTLIDDRIALSMSDPGDFSSIGIPVREVPAVMPPGRAFRAGERPREVQWGLLDDSGVGTEQVRVLFEEIGKQVEAAGVELQDFSALSARDDRDDGRAARESRVHVAAVRDAVAALV